MAMVDAIDCMVELEEMALALEIGHLSISATTNAAGRWQVGHKPPGGDGYSISVNDNLFTALYEVLVRTQTAGSPDLGATEADDFSHLI